MFKCYFQTDYDNKESQCKNEQEEYWCSEEHKNAWQDENYKGRTIRGTKKLTIEEMQERLRNMGKLISQ